ncbi:MAG: phosphodiesterase [Lachnospiraceae bacterium]|nr:phosphodiesterase [Lachnospiraceae bacterium]
MKWMIASDIHGSAFYCEQMICQCKHENADRLLLLGDILYHGPRNDLPKGYDPKAVIAMLNGMREDLLCIRGNCDCEVDQMVLQFPILAEYAVLDLGKCLVFATHGHVYHRDALPPIKSGDILLYGHTHVPVCVEQNGILCMNPGSVSIPKENSPHGYMTYENGVFRWKSLEGEEYRKVCI